MGGRRKERTHRIGASLTIGVAVAFGLLLPARGRAQLESECAQAAGDYARAQQYCQLVAQTAQLAQPRLGLGLSGGNPVPGTASTLGKGLAGLPRFSVDLRATAVSTKIPDIRQEQSTEELSFALGSIGADASVGVFDGFSPVPTVGGLLSVDLLASAGFIPIPSGEGFQNEKPWTWAAGARLGILRESFVTPGVSVSAMYRSLPTVTYGDPELQTEDAFFQTNLKNTSVRAVVSKSLIVVGLAAGIGYDHYKSDVGFGVSVPAPALPTLPPACLSTPGRCEYRVEGAEISSHRMSYFGNVSLNFLLLNLVGELGWQSGGDLPTAAVDSRLQPNDGSIFGSLALRLTL